MSISYSIVVPAYKECGNLKPLTERVFAAMKKAGMEKCELIIVDDNSRDGSVEVVDALRKEKYNVQILVRTTERGLSSAVIHGIKNSKGDSILCMDADLQHPPETVPSLFKALTESNDVEFVLGTRYAAGVAIDKDWPVHRRIISWGARLLARPLTPMSDPMSGFFGLRKDVFNRGAARVSPLGYKIALELYVKCKIQKCNEVGFSFAARTVGESKLTGKVIVHYLYHLKALYTFVYGTLLAILLIFMAAIFFYLGLIFLN
jgi:dolichol-phosphate mannosyltransferase